jgi:hypothetical protein
LTARIRAGGDAKPDAGGALPLSDNDFELASISDRLAQIAQEQQVLAKAGQVLDASIEATPSNETALNSLERNHLNLQAQYNAAVSRLADASTGQQIELRLKGERLSLIESAVPPQAPVSPKRKLLLIGTMLAALALGLAAVIVPELLNRRIRRPVELVDKLEIRPMITIPYIVTDGQKNRKRLTSLAATVAVVGAIPLLVLALHAYVMPVDAVMNRTLASLGFGEQSRNG